MFILTCHHLQEKWRSFKFDDLDFHSLGLTGNGVDSEKVIGKKPKITNRSVRFRTLGCFPLTGAVESTASTLAEVVQETLLTSTSERQGRVIDKDAGGAGMEKKKQEGYF